MELAPTSTTEFTFTVNVMRDRAVGVTEGTDRPMM